MCKTSYVPAREGVKPLHEEKQKFAAKPASKGVRTWSVKLNHDAASGALVPY
jgi:hypothetical protein